jgi:hypothetical protein
MRSLLAAFVALVLLPQAAEACNRCGRSPCRFVQHHAAAVVAAPVVATPTNVFVVQNTYPAPLVAGGTTGYVSNGGLQSQLAPTFDFDRYASIRLELKRADAVYAAQDSQQLNALADRALALQAPVAASIAEAQRITAAGQAVSATLRATTTAPQSTGFVVAPDGRGGMSVQPLTAVQIQSLTATVATSSNSATSTGDPNHGAKPLPQAPAQPLPSLGKFPLLGQFCGKCHGVDVAAPKGGFFLGDDDNVAKTMRERFFDIVDSIETKKMPPADSPQPTDGERAGILNEIQSLIKTRRGAP